MFENFIHMFTVQAVYHIIFPTLKCVRQSPISSRHALPSALNDYLDSPRHRLPPLARV